MRTGRVWARLLGVDKTVVERVEFDEDAGELVAHVRPARGERRRCGVCRRRCPGYDPGEGRRRWRSLDLGVVWAVVEADAPRVRCVSHGVVVAAVTWARLGAGHTRFLDDQVAWLAVTCSKSAVMELMRIAWRTVGAIITRVASDAMAGVDRFADLRRTLAGALRRHLDEHRVVTTWDRLCRPVLVELIRRHLDHGGCIDAEHLLSWAISSALHQVTGAARTAGSRTTLLACAAGERHTLALEALRAALAEQGVPAQMLGVDLPTEALTSALLRLRPDSMQIGRWRSCERWRAARGAPLW